MGRKPALDSTKRAEVLALIAVGCSRRSAARYVGCSCTTIRNTATHHPEFRQQLRNAEAQAEVIPLRHLRAHAEKSWRAAAWLLERTGSRQFAKDPPDLEEESRQRLFRRLLKESRDDIEQWVASDPLPEQDGEEQDTSASGPQLAVEE